MKNIKINGVVYNDVEKINVKDEDNDLVAFIDTDTSGTGQEAATSDKIIEGYGAFVDGEFVVGSYEEPKFPLPEDGYYWYDSGSYGFTLLKDSNDTPFIGDVGLYYYSGDDVYTPGHCIFTELTGISYGTSGHYYYDGSTDFEKIHAAIIDSDGYYEVYSEYDYYTHEYEYYSRGLPDGYYKIYYSALTDISAQVVEKEGLYTAETDEHDTLRANLASGWYVGGYNGGIGSGPIYYALGSGVVYITNADYSHLEQPEPETNCILSCDDQGYATKYDSMSVGDEVTITLDNGQEYKLTRIS